MPLFTWLLKAAVLLSLALLAERLTRPLRLRRLLLIAGALGALGLPLLSWGLAPLAPAWIPPLQPALVVEWIPAPLGALERAAAAAPAPVASPVAPSLAGGWDGGRLLLLAWGLGSLLLALRALAGRIWLARVVAASRPAPAEWQRQIPGVRLCISDVLPGAGLVGPWPRAVLLPQSAAGWTPAQRSWVLLHEQAHAHAQDDGLLLLMQVLTIVLWPLPPAWLVRRRARLLAELAADDAVLESGVAPLVYASTLAGLAREERVGLVAASSRSLLEVRVRALIAGRRPGAAPAHLLLAGGASALAVGVLACTPAGQDSLAIPVAPVASAAAAAAATTVDVQALSAAVAAELQTLQVTWRPEDAAIVVMDAHTGAVLASGDLSDGALLGTPLELGSVVKPFTVAAALEAGVSAEVRLPGHDGRWSRDGLLIEDHRPAAWLTLTDVLAASSNIGAAELVTEVGAGPVLAALAAVGLEGLPVVADGSPEAAYLGMGLGVAVSPLQLAHAYAILGNDGVDPDSGAAIFRPETVAVVRQGLAAALGPEGTAHAASVPGRALGGKTGTNRLPDSSGHVATFAGLWQAPQGDTLAVVIVVVDPDTAQPYGGAVAAPASARLVQTLR